MKVKSKIIERGSTTIGCDHFSDDCKIDFAHGGIFFHDPFNKEPIGIVKKIIDDGESLVVEGEITKSKINIRLSRWKRFINWLAVTFMLPKPYENFVDLFATVGFGGIVTKRDGYNIKGFDLKEVSLIPKFRGDGEMG